ncbi:MAG: PEP-CTERM sorting domain-containing protein [Rhizomicrobium sp.]
MERIIAAALILVTTVAPAFAGTISVPEPATMTLFGLGAGGAYLVKRFIGRK